MDSDCHIMFLPIAIGFINEFNDFLGLQTKLRLRPIFHVVVK